MGGRGGVGRDEEAGGREGGGRGGAVLSYPGPAPEKHVCLFYCQEMEELAHRIAADTDNIELRKISWR